VFWRTNRRAKDAAAAIHQVFHAANHALNTLGTEAAVGFFARHPFVVSHEAGDMHVFKFGDLLSGLAFMLRDRPQPGSTSPMIATGFAGDFVGLTIETDYSEWSDRGPYRLKFTQPMRQPVGKLVKPVARELIKARLAYDLAAEVAKARADNKH
jgi:hypothetical protein